jgi:hypothetical protein
MNTGKEEPAITIEPVEEPVPAPTERPAPRDPAPANPATTPA